MFDSPDSLTRISAAPDKAAAAHRLPLGVADADEWLKGGLRRNALHEFHAGDTGDEATVMAFALLLGTQADRERPVLWLRAGRRQKRLPYGPGLRELGLSPDRVILLQLPDLQGQLRAAADSVRHGGASAIILEMPGRAPLFNLTASRRLTLAAERSGTMVLLARSQAPLMPSSAETRWQMASAPSSPLPAQAPGGPVFDLTLLRQKGGREGLHLQLEWDREKAAFQAPLSGGHAALLPGGAQDQRRSRAA
ncbi:ImuA family protein [Altericroceibacterium endophyticum]|uniref:Protein ImuA n=1 Tax=Altericroceibacterium endophyticum TaxID=1808508 RepID=A0A6I4T4R9_9SPHN|nr:hypothetical protein [Altericroceibacterium endophyticum]MXO65212.1 hypothetical protein [Altericroceibacterium endophyticum]